MIYHLSGGNVIESFMDINRVGAGQVSDITAAGEQDRLNIYDNFTNALNLSVKQKEDFKNIMQSSGFLIAGATALVVMVVLFGRKKK
jgi:hypothetical protein